MKEVLGPANFNPLYYGVH